MTPKTDNFASPFELIPLFQWKRLKKRKSLESGDNEIQFKQVLDFAKIFPIYVLDSRHPGLSKS